MTTYPVKPTTLILADGEPLEMEWKAATASAILPGDLVQFNNAPTDCTIKEAAADSTEVIGVAAISPVPGATPPRGGDRTTAFEAGDQVKTIRGPITAMLRIASSQEIQCGEFVQPAASGEVKAYICGTDNDCQRIAQALETTSVDTTSFQWGIFALERLS